MIFELKRIKNNYIGICSILACILSAILGFFLIVSLDGYKMEEISLGMLQYSIYTVYTQFGFFIFPVLSSCFISVDYKEKNIAFYKLLGFNAYSYFLCKLIPLLLFITIGNTISSIAISLIYKDFSNTLLFLFKIENVTIFIIAISLFYAYLFKSMMVAYCVNFAVWVISIVLSAVKSFFEIFCFYDASLERHSSFQKVFESGIFMDNSVVTEMFYNIIVILISLIVINILQKRWMKNGI